MNRQPIPRRIAWFAPWTWKRGTKIIAGLLLVFVGYPLSLGPFVWLHDRGALPAGSGKYIMTVYTPLRLTLQTDLGQRTLGRYVDLWEPPPPP